MVEARGVVDPSARPRRGHRGRSSRRARLATVRTTLAQWDALRAIDRIPGSTARALAEETFQSEQAFGTLANRLVTRGLIERTPGRGRAIEHRLTVTGSQVLRAGHRVANEVLTESFAALSAGERATLLDLLHRIGTHG
ncbi:MarR family winged helix-turn-helix transcriptional regulator [Nocardia sp. CA-120079]|uniref:MarR family winged helix-turn-helix transcriptional regulator n=1 Tax=Nocardia sp. CA-120079 TaxID=3239974 RepID=UPI003D9965C7